jgi:signal transduction histidine kinase
VVLLSALWEFFLEDLLVPHIYAHYHPEPLYERLEFIFSSLFFAAIALILPARLVLNSVRDADQTRSSLSSAYSDLEERVQERTRELVDANEQLKSEIVQRQQSEEALHKSEKELRLLSSQLLSAQENERQRIALDIHDNVSQKLVAMKFRVELALDEFDRSGEKSAELSRILIPVIQQSIDEVREIYMRLRPSMLDDLGLLATLSWLWRDFQDTNPGVRFHSDIDIEEGDIPENLKVVIFRVMQEGLDNVSRHSKADEVHVALTRENDNVELTMQDDGIGISLEEVLSVDDSLRGMGLSGMRERVELVGGTFRIDGEKGKGTQVHASWPLLVQ